jgi:SP family myo-inositol transporter-like MFS transporter 13
LLGAFFGSLIAGPLADSLGRKPIIIISDLLFLIGAIVMCSAQTIIALMLGRIIVGFGVGIASMIVPVYLSEVSPICVRGRVVAWFVVVITAGQLISSIISLFLGRNWRLMLGLSIIPAFI